MPNIALKLSVQRIQDWQNKTFGVRNAIVVSDEAVQWFLDDFIAESDAQINLEVETFQDGTLIAKMEGDGAEFQDVVARIDKEFGLIA